MKKAYNLLILAGLLSITAYGQTPQDTARPANAQRPTWTYILEVDTAGKLTLIDSVANLPGAGKEIKVKAPNARREADSLKKVAAANTKNPGPGNSGSSADITNKQKAAGTDAQKSPREIEFWVLFFTSLVGGAVGLSEILNRYKTFNQLLLRNTYSLSYILINMLAAILFYWIVVRYDLHLGPLTEHRIGLVLTCGLGAMAFLRSSFFNYKDAAGKVIEIGPAALLTVYLRAAERNFDQCLARNCVDRMGALMNDKDIKFLSASKDLPILVLTSMQVLSDDEQKALAAEVLKLVEDTNTTEDVKKITLGAIIERYAGTELIRICVANLIKIYQNERAANLDILDNASQRL